MRVEEQATVWSGRLVAGLAGLALLGAAVFLWAVSGEAALRAWQIYLVNYLFWSGLAIGGVVLAAIWHVSRSVWGKAFQGLAVAGTGFFPFVLVLFLPLMAAGGTLFRWARESPEHRAGWMTPGFVFGRDLLSVALLLLLCALFAYFRLRPVLGAQWENSAQATGEPPVWLKGWRGLEVELARTERALSRLAPLLFVVFALVFTLLSYDLVVALDPHWYSTLFGGYFFFGSVYAGLAWLAVLGILLFRSGRARGVLTAKFLHPLGKLLFGFCLFHGMLFYSQYLPIWYGNLPHETEFVIVRTAGGFWPLVSWAFLLLSLPLPFVLLLGRRAKSRPLVLGTASVLILVGMWLDRFISVVPSVWREGAFPFGWAEAAITVGFAALMMLSYYVFNRFFPLLHYDPAHLRVSYH